MVRSGSPGWSARGWRADRGAAIGLVALAVACSSATRGPAPVTSVDEDAQQAAAKRARSMVNDVYRSLRRGKVASLQTLLAPDVLVIGPAPGDVFVSRTDAVVAITDGFDVGARHRLKSRQLVASSSPAGTSAWVADRITVGRVSYTMTAVLAEIDDLWFVVAVSVAQTDRRDPGDAGALAALPAADPATSDVVGLFETAAATPAVFVDQLAGGGDVVAFGADAKQHARGHRRVERMWRKTDAADQRIAIDGVHARTTPDGALAWVVANAKVGDGDDGGAAPRRVFAIYQRAPDAGWQLVALQQAAPAPR